MMAAPDVPLLPLHHRNDSQRWCIHLPMRDRALASFLVKVSDVLVNGILSLNVFGATYFLNWGASRPNDDRLSVCSTTNSYWKAFVFGLPFALYILTVLISGVAKSAEVNLRGLTTLCILVLMEMVWCILLGALLTHCMSGASSIGIFCVAGFIIVLLMAVWAFTFNHPTCFRLCCWSFCCCGLDPEIAASEARDQVIATEELAVQVARAQAAYAAQVRSQEHAVALKKEVEVANEDMARANEVHKTKQDEATLALKTLQTAEEELTAKTSTRDNAADVLTQMIARANLAKEQALAGGEVDTPLEQMAAAAADKALDDHISAEKDVSDAKEKYDNASTDNDTAQNTCKEAYDEASRVSGVADRKLKEATSAKNKAKDACTNARAMYEEAVAAQSFARLVG